MYFTERKKMCVNILTKSRKNECFVLASLAFDMHRLYQSKYAENRIPNNIYIKLNIFSLFTFKNIK